MVSDMYASTRHRTFTKKEKCKSEFCKQFRCMSVNESCGRECVEAQYLCDVCSNRRVCDSSVVKKYIRMLVNDMVDKKGDRTFEAIEVSGEQLVEVHVLHEHYQLRLKEIRRSIGELSGFAKFTSGKALTNEGFDLKLKIEVLRKFMDMLNIEYEESVSLKPQY